MGVIEVGDPGPAAGVYTISVAAELAGVTIRSLRLYERHGLLRARPHQRRHPPVQPGRPAPATPDRRAGRRRGQPHRHRQDPRPGTGHPRTSHRQHRATSRQLPAAGHPGRTPPDRAAPDPDRNRPGGDHRRGTPRPTGTATNRPDPADPHPARRISAPTNGTTNHAIIQLDQRKDRAMPDPAQSAVTALPDPPPNPSAGSPTTVPTDTWWWSTSLYTDPRLHPR